MEKKCVQPVQPCEFGVACITEIITVLDRPGDCHLGKIQHNFLAVEAANKPLWKDEMLDYGLGAQDL